MQLDSITAGAALICNHCPWTDAAVNATLQITLTFARRVDAWDDYFLCEVSSQAAALSRCFSTTRLFNREGTLLYVRFHHFEHRCPFRALRLQLIPCLFLAVKLLYRASMYQTSIARPLSKI